MEVALHIGTLLAIFAGYRNDLLNLLQGLIDKQMWARRTMALVIIATVPAVVIGYVLEEWISQWFFPLAVGAGWLMTTAALWLTPPATRGDKVITNLTWGSALVIGLAQSVALWPGLSRSGTTIFAGRVLGLAPQEAARFSFYMAIPVTLGASVLILIPGNQLLSGGSNWAIVFGMGMAAISGIFAIEWVKHALATTRLWRQFGWYTLILGVVTFWLGGF